MARRPSRTLLSPGPLVLVLILFPMYRPLLFILLLTHKPLFQPLMQKPDGDARGARCAMRSALHT